MLSDNLSVTRQPFNFLYEVNKSINIAIVCFVFYSYLIFVYLIGSLEIINAAQRKMKDPRSATEIKKNIKQKKQIWYRLELFDAYLDKYAELAT